MVFFCDEFCYVRDTDAYISILFYLLSGRQLLWGNTARRPCCALYLGFPSILDDDLTTRDTIFMGRHSSQFPFTFSLQLLFPILHSPLEGTS